MGEGSVCAEGMSSCGEGSGAEEILIIWAFAIASIYAAWFTLWISNTVQGF